MTDNLPLLTLENEELTERLEQLRLEFLDLFTRHKDMVENESAVLTSIYLQKLGHLQLEPLQKQTEAAMIHDLVCSTAQSDQAQGKRTFDLAVQQLQQDTVVHIIEEAFQIDINNVLITPVSVGRSDSRLTATTYIPLPLCGCEENFPSQN